MKIDNPRSFFHSVTNAKAHIRDMEFQTNLQVAFKGAGKPIYKFVSSNLCLGCSE